MRIAVIHDWLTGMRGGEKVLEAILAMYPDAHLYTLLLARGTVSPRIESRVTGTSFVDHLPLAASRYRYYLPLFPLAIERFDLQSYDLLISTSHCVAKGAIPRAGAVHVSYIHSPMRYIWDLHDEYFGVGRGSPAQRLAMALFRRRLQRWDVGTSGRVTHYLANSRNIAGKIRALYGREATVIYPPVDTGLFHVSSAPDGYYLMVTAFVPYKRIDLAVDAFTANGKRLLIIGDGPEREKLASRAGRNIEFLGWQKHDILTGYYSRCRALIMPGEEDFGITPVEAMASGRPVIALGKGGAVETVRPLGGPGKPTGVFFYEKTPRALAEAIGEFERAEDQFDPAAIRESSLRFDTQVFTRQLGTYIGNALHAEKT